MDAIEDEVPLRRGIMRAGRVMADRVGPVEVGAEGLVPLVGGHVGDGGPLPDAVVDHDEVEALQGALGLGDEAARLGGLGDVGAAGEGDAAGSLHEGAGLAAAASSSSRS